MACAAASTEDGSRENPFVFRAGLTATLELEALQRNGRAYDLTGRTGAGSLRRNIDDTVAISTWTVTLTTPTRGLAEAEIGADVTADLEGLYITDVEFALSAADVVGTMSFYVKFVKEATR